VQEQVVLEIVAVAHRSVALVEVSRKLAKSVGVYVAFYVRFYYFQGQLQKHGTDLHGDFKYEKMPAKNSWQAQRQDDAPCIASSGIRTMTLFAVAHFR